MRPLTLLNIADFWPCCWMGFNTDPVSKSHPVGPHILEKSRSRPLRVSAHHQPLRWLPATHGMEAKTRHELIAWSITHVSGCKPCMPLQHS